MTLYDKLPGAFDTAHREAARSGVRYRVEVFQCIDAPVLSIVQVKSPRRTSDART